MKRLYRLAKIALLTAGLWLWPLAVMAQQQWEKVEGKPADQIPAVPFVGYAYGFIWVAVLAYVLYLARGLGQVNSQIADLRRKIGKEIGGEIGAGSDGGGAREAGRR